MAFPTMQSAARLADFSSSSVKRRGYLATGHARRENRRATADQATTAHRVGRSSVVAGQTDGSPGHQRPPTDGPFLRSASETTATSQTLPRPPSRGQRTAYRTRARPSFMVEHAFLLFSSLRIAPTHRLCANMQIHSDVDSHLRLLIQPMPNGSGREYQPSPQRRVSGCRKTSLFQQASLRPVQPLSPQACGHETAQPTSAICETWSG